MVGILLSFISAFVITYVAIPSIIRLAEKKHLFDEPDERSSHVTKKPTLGGLAVFAGLVLSFAFWAAPFASSYSQYILSAIIILFFVGIKDDMFPLTPIKKFAGQVIAAMIIVFAADIRLTNMHGVLGITEISYSVSVILSMFTIILIINAYNLIDGIDGLSAGLGIIASLTFGTAYVFLNNAVLAILAFSLAGALLAFLRYNFSPSQIFMGDTGSLVLGVVLSIFAMQLLEYDKLSFNFIGEIDSAPAFVIAILIIPLFDTLRVFCIRIFVKKCSPFKPDKNHIHHVMVIIGFSHKTASLTLYAVNLFFIMLAFMLKSLGNNSLLVILLSIAFILSQIPFFIKKRQKSSSLSLFGNKNDTQRV